MNNRQAGRRGRGRNTNNRNQGNRGGGMDRDNRIDNRARGNAAQMLDKYKKMAQDAQVNGDRVQAEYYHQFADHYFRVNADTQARREEQRQAREESRGDNRGNGQDDGNEKDGDNGRGRQQHNRQSRDDREQPAAEGAVEEKKPVRSRRPRKSESAAPRTESVEKNGDSNGLDASALPPAISASTDVEVEKKPARKKRVAAAQPVEEGDAL